MRGKRVIVPRHGGPDVLQVLEEELPDPAPEQCRARVRVAGVAYVDVMQRKSLYPVLVPRLPFTPGRDFGGVVDALGEGVTGIHVGQAVAGLVGGNTYAEYILCPAESLIAVPEGVELAEAACLPLNYVTAYQMMYRFARARGGERALIHGAAGGVGTALLQLGRLVGLEMYGTASKAKHGLVRELGAVPIDYRGEDFVGRVRELTGDGVDMVFDHIGGRHLWRSFRVLRGGGRLIAYGEKSWIGEEKLNEGEKRWHQILMALLGRWPGREVRWYELDPGAGLIPPEWYREDLGKLMELLREGKIKPVIAERIPLEEARRGHELMDRGAVRGKLVLMC